MLVSIDDHYLDSFIHSFALSHLIYTIPLQDKYFVGEEMEYQKDKVTFPGLQS